MRGCKICIYYVESSIGGHCDAPPFHASEKYDCCITEEENEKL